MADAAAISKLAKAARIFTRDAQALIVAGSTTEVTYYPAVKTLIEAGLAAENLPFAVRINTSEKKADGGVNIPDVALYDGDGDFLVVCGEIKLPEVEISALAKSTENKDQIGRYLAATRAVLISNVRAFALLTADANTWTMGPFLQAAGA